MWDAFSGGVQPQPWHHIVIGALPYPNFATFGPHLHKYNSVRVHPCAHPRQHTMKVLRHFIYIQYGCMMQSAGVYSLNHDITTSFGLRLTPIFQNFALTFTVNIHILRTVVLDYGELLALLVIPTWLLHVGPGFETCLVPQFFGRIYYEHAYPQHMKVLRH
jgi:hypothetical protein